MKQEIDNIIKKTLNQIIIDLSINCNGDISDSTVLFGDNGILDSMALVSFITDLEEALSDELNLDVIIANEKAMSRSNSPFKSISNLSEFIVNLDNINNE